MTSSETTAVTVGGLTFDVDISGDEAGTPVLLLHGFPENRTIWRAITQPLTAAGTRCIAPDQRGYSPGARPPEVEAYAVAELVRDAVRLLDALNAPAAHVVGHDWGAIVAWNLAARHPDRTLSLTAVSVPHPRAVAQALADADSDQGDRSAYIAFFRKEPDKAEHVLLKDDAAALRAVFADSGLAASAVDGFVEPLQQPGALKAALSWYRALSRSDAAESSPVRVPTTYIWGDRDIAVSREAAEACGAFVDGDYSFVPLAGVSHWVLEQRPEVVVDAVRSRL